MYHIQPRVVKSTEVDYSKLLSAEEEKTRSNKPTPSVPDDDSLPEPPPGFAFYRIQSGDTLVSLSVKFNVSQNRIRRYNREICFGHRLTHIVNKLILVPMVNDAKVTPEIQQQLEQLLLQDESNQNNENEEKKYKEPDENGKYQLRKALIYHSKIDNNRANYYLGEANWNVRKALLLFKEDDKWDKQQRVLKACQGINENEAIRLLGIYGGDPIAAIQHWIKSKKETDKIAKRIQKNKQKNKSKNKDYDGIEMQLEKNDNTKDKDETNYFNQDNQDYSQFARPCC